MDTDSDKQGIRSSESPGVHECPVPSEDGNSNADTPRRRVLSVQETRSSERQYRITYSGNILPAGNSSLGCKTRFFSPKDIRSRKLSQGTTYFYNSNVASEATSQKRDSLATRKYSIPTSFPLYFPIDEHPDKAMNNPSVAHKSYDQTDSNIVKFTIDWRDIFTKAATYMENDLELELINYFHNSNLNFQMFPASSLYRFITFNDVLSVVFNALLLPRGDADFHLQILKNVTKMNEIDYDLNSYNIGNIIRCNVKKLQQMAVDCNVKKKHLAEKSKQVMKVLSQYLTNPENSSKMYHLIDTINVKVQILIDCLVTMAMSLSLWKLFNDIPGVSQGIIHDTTTVTNCKQIFSDIRLSVRKIEDQVNTLLKQFKDENTNEVLTSFCRIFDETIELCICIPVLKYKIAKDELMMNASANLPNGADRKEQFV